MKTTKRHSVDSIPTTFDGGTYVFASFTSILVCLIEQGYVTLREGEVVQEFVLENKGMSFKIGKEE